MQRPSEPGPALEAAWAARLVVQLERGCRKTQHALERLAALWSPPRPRTCFRPERHRHHVVPGAHDVEVVARYARDERLPVRRAALLALGQATSHEAARRALVDAAAAGSWEVRGAALVGLARAAGEPAVVAAHRARLADPSFTLRWRAAQALAGSAHRDEALAALLASPPRGVRFMAEWLHACAAFGPDALEAGLLRAEAALAEARRARPDDASQCEQLAAELRWLRGRQGRPG